MDPRDYLVRGALSVTLVAPNTARPRIIRALAALLAAALNLLAKRVLVSNTGLATVRGSAEAIFRDLRRRRRRESGGLARSGAGLHNSGERSGG